jgi:hypothetical protein
VRFDVPDGDYGLVLRLAETAGLTTLSVVRITRHRSVRDLAS